MKMGGERKGGPKELPTTEAQKGQRWIESEGLGRAEGEAPPQIQLTPHIQNKNKVNGDFFFLKTTLCRTVSKAKAKPPTHPRRKLTPREALTVASLLLGGL